MTLKWKDSTKYLGVKEGTVTERWIELESLIERLELLKDKSKDFECCIEIITELKQELEHLKEVNENE
jgi:hypothetical protein